MSKEKHTPGPWICHSGAVWKDGVDVYPKGPHNGIPIAKMDREPYNGTLPVERDANARLIAAAPDLLEALEILETAGILDEKASDSTEWNRSRRIALTVIAKTKG